MSAVSRDQLHFWYLVTFLLGWVEGMVGTFFPLVYLQRGGSLVGLSLMVSFVSLAGLLQVVWGRIIDRHHRPKVLATASLVANSGALITMGVAPTAEFFGGARVGQGMTTSAFNNANAYLRSSYFPSSKRGRIGNLFMGFNLGGVALGVFLAGIFYELAGYGHASFVHWIAAYLTAVVLLLVWRYIPEFEEDLVADEQLRFAMVEERAHLNYSLQDTMALIRRSPGLLLFTAGTLLFHFAVGISGPFFVVELNRTWSLSSLEIGYITTFNAVLQVVIVFLFTPVVDIINRKAGFTVGVAFAVLPVVAMVLEPGPVIGFFGSSLVFWLLVYTLSSLGWGLVNALSLTLLIDYINPKIRATVVGVYGSLQAVMVFLASVIAALLIAFGATIQLIFWLSVAGRTGALLILLATAEPPLPSSDFYERRKIFITRMYATVERGIVWLPVVGSILSRKRSS